MVACATINNFLLLPYIIEKQPEVPANFFHIFIQNLKKRGVTQKLGDNEATVQCFGRGDLGLSIVAVAGSATA